MLSIAERNEQLGKRYTKRQRTGGARIVTSIAKVDELTGNVLGKGETSAITSTGRKLRAVFYVPNDSDCRRQFIRQCRLFNIVIIPRKVEDGALSDVCFIGRSDDVNDFSYYAAYDACGIEESINAINALDLVSHSHYVMSSSVSDTARGSGKDKKRWKHPDFKRNDCPYRDGLYVVYVYRDGKECEQGAHLTASAAEQQADVLWEQGAELITVIHRSKGKKENVLTISK